MVDPLIWRDLFDVRDVIFKLLNNLFSQIIKKAVKKFKSLFVFAYNLPSVSNKITFLRKLIFLKQLIFIWGNTFVRKYGFWGWVLFIANSSSLKFSYTNFDISVLFNDNRWLKCNIVTWLRMFHNIFEIILFFA